MSNAIHLHYDVSAEDFTRAGEASGFVKKRLKSLGFNPDAIRRVAIAMYEAEINMVIHANGGFCDVDIYPDRIEILLSTSVFSLCVYKNYDLAQQSHFHKFIPETQWQNKE